MILKPDEVEALVKMQKKVEKIADRVTKNKFSADGKEKITDVLSWGAECIEDVLICNNKTK